MSWLTGDWESLLPQPWAHIVLAIAAAVCGAIVGAEREKREKPAGIRTLILVGLGSATFTMVSFAFGTTTGDTGRVAAQIVTGIGFLGAGVILHGRTFVTGITTAATIWAASAMGMVIGVGYVGAGLGLSVLIRVVLSGVYWWEHHVAAGSRPTVVELLLDGDHGKTWFRLNDLLGQFHLHDALEHIADEADGSIRVRLRFCLSRHHRTEFLNELASRREVREMREILEQE
jgi:putative Mg2+ transporter-C (MgtC) family protein